MKNCSDDIIKYHNAEVSLGSNQQSDMRDRRSANRKRLASGLAKMERKGPSEHVVQGSYAMKTMVQHPDNNYDIDDGAAFLPEQLKTATGLEMTSRQAKELVRDALMKDDRLPSEPEILKNCVRVNYEGGYHVDIPVYRATTAFGQTKFEIAGVEWRKTNPREITEWFDERVAATKRGDESDPQLRRMVRLIKKYARVQCGDTDAPSGLILTVLVNEAHPSNQDREDEALRSVLQRVKRRLDGYWQVYNPRDTSEQLTKPADQAKLTRLAAKIGASLIQLAKLDEASCSRALARSTWDDVFKTDYFNKLEEVDREVAASGIRTPDRPVNKQGGGTYA